MTQIDKNTLKIVLNRHDEMTDVANIIMKSRESIRSFISQSFNNKIVTDGDIMKKIEDVHAKWFRDYCTQPSNEQKQMPLTNVLFFFENLEYKNYSFITFNKCVFYCCNLHLTDFTNCIFNNCEFPGSQLDAANLRNAVLNCETNTQMSIRGLSDENFNSCVSGM